MSFDELVKSFLLEYDENYDEKIRIRASNGGPVQDHAKPAGFMGDDGRAGVNGVLPKGMFPQKQNKRSKNKYKK